MWKLEILNYIFGLHLWLTLYFFGQCFYEILLTSKIYLFVDEEKTPEHIMQEKQIEAYVLF